MNVENNKKVNEGSFGDYKVHEEPVYGSVSEKNKRCKKMCGNANRWANIAHITNDSPNKCKCFKIPGKKKVENLILIDLQQMSSLTKIVSSAPRTTLGFS